jgi:hypothetical protein
VDAVAEDLDDLYQRVEAGLLAGDDPEAELSEVVDRFLAQSVARLSAQLSRPAPAAPVAALQSSRSMEAATVAARVRRQALAASTDAAALWATARGGSLLERRAALARLAELGAEDASVLDDIDLDSLKLEVELERDLHLAGALRRGAPGRDSRSALAAAKSTLDRFAAEVLRTLDGVRDGDSFLDLDPHERARLMLHLRGAEDSTVAFLMDRLQQLLAGGETAEACDRIAALRPAADPRTLPVLAGALLDDARSDVRAEAARAIARIDDRRVPVLLGVASARASEIGERLALAEALGIWGDMRGTDIVRECLADPRDALRISALEALYDPTLAELGMASARSGSLDERRAALRAVGRAGEEQALLWLDGLVQEDPPPALSAEIRAARGSVLARVEMRGEAPAELLERTRRAAPRVKALARKLGAPPTKRHRFAAWLLMLRAVIARLFGLRETASSLCDRALAADPGWHQPALYQGNLWLARGDKSRAVAGFRRALHIAPAALLTNGDVMTRITNTYLARTDELMRGQRVEAARALVDELMFLDLSAVPAHVRHAARRRRRRMAIASLPDQALEGKP